MKSITHFPTNFRCTVYVISKSYKLVAFLSHLFKRWLKKATLQFLCIKLISLLIKFLYIRTFSCNAVNKSLIYLMVQKCWQER